MSRCDPASIAAGAAGVLLTIGSLFAAVDANPQKASVALSPLDSLQQIVVDPGLKVELVASEPHVMSPVAIRFDENGRMWVVEMCDYPTGPTKEFPQTSRISILTDRDGDGFFETANVFADGLSFATGVQPWKGGAFVTMAGQVAYLKDTNGDGKADVTEAWYTGFAEGNQQLRANHPTLGLDNHMYIANGLLGGNVRDARSPGSPPISISGRDFRFNPETRAFEGVSGVGQFGLTFDDFGNRFVCTNRNPAIHIVLNDQNLKKNPAVMVSSVSHDVAASGGRSHLHSIGRTWVTSNLHEGQFTAACGVNVYRGDALPKDYYGNIYTCDPTARVVHRETMKPNGVTFNSVPAANDREFYATKDEWSCPVNLEVGPDGAMYVVDMYRQIIEHPHWMPEELRNRPNMRAGIDKGRIYRVVPVNFQRKTLSQLSQAPSETLVAELTSPNAWRGQTAARLLLERQDKSIAARLLEMASGSESNVGRIRAIWLMEGLGVGNAELLLKLCDDPDPRIVEQAVIAADAHLSNSPKLKERIVRLAAENPDARVRFNALFTAMPLPQAPKFPIDEWEMTAILVATESRGGTVLAEMLDHSDTIKANVAEPERFIGKLARLAATSTNNDERMKAITALVGNIEYGRAGLAAFLSEMQKKGLTIDQIRMTLNEETRKELDRAFASAQADASDTNQKELTRCEAIDLLSLANGAIKLLTPIAKTEKNQEVRLRAIAALAKSEDLTPWKELLQQFYTETPAVQRSVIDNLYSNVARTNLLLDEIEAGRLKPAVVDRVHSQQLLKHKNVNIAERAKHILEASVPADREKVLAEYQPVLNLKADAARGKIIFKNRCSTCHQIGDVGVKFAPDISDSRVRKPEQLLTDILQPNRAIDSNYYSYTAMTVDGRVHTGVLAAETSTSVTLMQQEGKSETLRRDEIEDLYNNGVSYMPEGLEKDIPMQDMADLISFIKNWRYLDSTPSDTGTARPQAGL